MARIHELRPIQLAITIQRDIFEKKFLLKIG